VVRGMSTPRTKWLAQPIQPPPLAAERANWFGPSYKPCDPYGAGELVGCELQTCDPYGAGELVGSELQAYDP
jgi:hypothetical protein